MDFKEIRKGVSVHLDTDGFEFFIINCHLSEEAKGTNFVLGIDVPKLSSLSGEKRQIIGDFWSKELAIEAAINIQKLIKYLR